MKFELFNNEANKLWKKMSGELAPNNLNLELELYKKLLNFFQVGDYFYFIFNLNKLDFDLVSPEAEKLLGYQISEITTPFFMEIIHPEDRPWFLTFENKTAEFLTSLPVEKLMKYKARYDFRMKKKNGEYIRILHQVVVIQHDEKGGIIRTLGVHTDISHLKMEGKPLMSYIGLDGEPSYLNVDVTNPFAKSEEILSKREKEILVLLIDGKTSKEISGLLYISTQTVETHRKNMLQKSQMHSTVELVSKAIKQGWV